MTRRAKLWSVVAAVLYTGVNLAGAGVALAQGERLHAAGHIGLLVLGAFVASLLAARARRQGVPDVPDVPDVARADERIEHLQQSIDAVAIEVERIGEAQRFNAKLQSERAKTQR